MPFRGIRGWRAPAEDLLSLLAISFPPPPKEMVLNVEVIKYLADGLADDVFDGLGLVIKRRNRGEEVRAHVSGHGHEP